MDEVDIAMLVFMGVMLFISLLIYIVGIVDGIKREKEWENYKPSKDDKPLPEIQMQDHCTITRRDGGLYATLNCMICPYHATGECDEYVRRHKGHLPDGTYYFD